MYIIDYPERREELARMLSEHQAEQARLYGRTPRRAAGGKTIKEQINDIISEQWDFDNPLNKLVVMTYYIGRESATREVSDKYNAMIAQMRERAKKLRYHRLASAVIGDENYIYSPDYAGDMTSAFGGDPAVPIN